MRALREPLDALAQGAQGAQGGQGGEGGEEGEGEWASAAPAISVEEVPAAELRIEKRDALQRFDVGEPCSDLFWEPPPVRLFILRGVNLEAGDCAPRASRASRTF